MRHLVSLERSKAEAALSLRSRIAQAHFWHSRFLRQIDLHKIRKRSHHGRRRPFDTPHRTLLLHSTGFLVIRRYRSDVIEPENTTVQHVHDDGPQIVLLVVDRHRQNRPRVDDSPYRPDDVAEIRRRRPGSHKVAVRHGIESKQTITGFLGLAETGRDRGGQRPQRTLVALGAFGMLEESPDVIVHIEDRLAHGKKAGDEVAYGGHSWDRDMQVAVRGRVQRGLVCVVFGGRGNEDVDLFFGNFVGLENGQRLITQRGRALVAGNCDDPCVGLSCSSSRHAVPLSVSYIIKIGRDR